MQIAISRNNKIKMIMINRALLSTFILLLSIKIFGQTDFYFSFSGTYAFIPGMEFNDGSSFTDPFGQNVSTVYTESYNVKPGLTLETGINKKIINRFAINTAIGFSFCQFKKEVKIDFIDNSALVYMPGMPYNYYYGIQPGDFRFQDLSPENQDSVTIGNPNLGKTKVLYLSIPVKVHYSFLSDRCRMGIGITNDLVVYSCQVKNLVESDGDTFILREYKDKSSNGLNNYQLNGVVSLEYKIFRGIRIEATYSHGFLMIYDKQLNSNYPPPLNNNAKYRTVGIGLKYFFR